MEKDTTLKTTDAGSETAVPMPDAPETTRLVNFKDMSIFDHLHSLIVLMHHCCY